MIELDPSKLPPEVATLLFGRGAGVPPLEWQPRVDRTAKQTLDQIADAALVGGEAVADEGMVAVVRALLYLWNGWIGEARMYAEAAPEAERRYLVALCERQSGNADAAKSAFQELDGHPVYEPLANAAVEAIGLGSDPVVDRFAQMLKLGEAWEPFAFIDVYEQARAGKLSQASEHLVCSVQCVEFELLFIHCYTAAIGKSIPLRRQPDAPASRPRKRAAARRQSARPPRPDTTSPKAPAEETRPEKRTEERKPSRPKIALRCPKCAAQLRVPEEGRGARARCDKCGAVFLIPARQSEPATAGAAEPAE